MKRLLFLILGTIVFIFSSCSGNNGFPETEKISIEKITDISTTTIAKTTMSEIVIGEETYSENAMPLFHLPEKYINIPDKTNLLYYNAIFPVYKDGYVDFIDNNGNLISDYDFDRGGFMYDEMSIVQKGEYYGAIDKTGTLSVPLIYEYMENYSCGLALVKGNNGKYGYIDKLGKTVIPFEYSYARSFSEDIAIVSVEGFKNSIFLFIDKTGNVIGQGIFNNPYHWGDFHNGLMVNGYAYYNINGECVIGNNFNYDFIEGRYPDNFYEELAIYPLLKDEFVESFDFSKGDFMQFFEGKNWYTIFIDKNGNDVFNKRFDYAGRFSEGLAVVEVDGKTGCIDKTGEFTFFNDNIMPWDIYSEGFIAYWIDANPDTYEYKYGFLDNKGDIVISAIYDDMLRGFTNGLSLMKSDKKLVYINYNGETIFEFEVPEGENYRRFILWE